MFNRIDTLLTRFFPELSESSIDWHATSLTFGHAMLDQLEAQTQTLEMVDVFLEKTSTLDAMPFVTIQARLKIIDHYHQADTRTLGYTVTHYPYRYDLIYSVLGKLSPKTRDRFVHHYLNQFPENPALLWFCDKRLGTEEIKAMACLTKWVKF